MANVDYDDLISSGNDTDCDEGSEQRNSSGSGNKKASYWSGVQIGALKSAYYAEKKKSPVDMPWVEVAKFVPGKNAKQCRTRWTNQDDPRLKKDKWSVEEEYVLMLATHVLGIGKWAAIQRKYLHRRAENAMKNKWNAAERKKNSAEKKKKETVAPSFFEEYVKAIKGIQEDDDSTLAERYMRAFQELSSSYVGDIGKVDIYHFVKADVASISADGSLEHQESSIMSSRPSDGEAIPTSKKGGRPSAAAGMAALKSDTGSDPPSRSQALPKGISSGSKRSSEPGYRIGDDRLGNKVPLRLHKSEGGHSPQPSSPAFKLSAYGFGHGNTAGFVPAGMSRQWPDHQEPWSMSSPHPGTFNPFSCPPDGKRYKATERIEELTPAFSAVPLAFSSPRVMQDLMTSEPNFGKLASDSRLLASGMTGGMGQTQGIDRASLLSNGGGSAFLTHQPYPSMVASSVKSSGWDQLLGVWKEPVFQPSFDLHTDHAMAMVPHTVSQQKPLTIETPSVLSSAVSLSMSDTDFEELAALLLAEDADLDDGNKDHDMDAPRMLDLAGLGSGGSDRSGFEIEWDGDDDYFD